MLRNSECNFTMAYADQLVKHLSDEELFHIFMGGKGATEPQQQ